MVEINNLTTVEIDVGFIKKIIDAVLKGEGVGQAGGASAVSGAAGGLPNVSVAFLGPGRMRKLNKQYRSKNRVTDVLSFTGGKVPFEKFKIGRIKQAEGLGEFVICPREVKKNAEKDGLEFENALARVVIHGVLHLLGFVHEKGGEQAEKMREKENQYLKTIL